MEQGAATLRDAQTGMQILVIDDDEASLAMIETILRRAGYSNVTTASDAATVAARFSNAAPDLLLLDLRMPGMSGFEMLGRLRPVNRAWANIPILVVSGDDSPGVRERALAMGAHDFLRKPVDADELVRRVETLLALQVGKQPEPRVR